MLRLRPFLRLVAIAPALVLATGSFVAAEGAAPGTSDLAARTVEAPHVEGPHVADGGEDWIVRWVAGDHVREDRVPKRVGINVPAWQGAEAVPGALLEPAEPPAAVFDMPERVLAVGDIHGRFAAFLSVLRSAGVIDEGGTWTFGADHLVCCGDLMNRDGDVVALLWFLRRLETEAADAGGAVHVILGNHEQLALQGDERYVHANQLDASRRLGVRYASLYGRDTVLGRWLRTRPSIIRIGDTAFTHGGISPQMIDLADAHDLDVDEVNRIMRENLGASREARDADPVLAGLYGTWGPFWHRGYFLSEPRYFPTSSDDLDRVLAWLDAERIVVGHTEFDRVGTHMEARVVACDVNLIRDPEAVLFAGDEIRRVRVGQPSEPITPLPR